MKLVSISFNSIPRMPGIRPGELCTIDCAKPKEGLTGWRVSIRGQQVFFISPAGWTSDNSNRKRDPNGPATIFEIPRTEVLFNWQADDAADVEAVLKSGKYESPPFGWKPAEVVADKPILAQVPVGQLGDA
jgi:hypothetical protein